MKISMCAHSKDINMVLSSSANSSPDVMRRPGRHVQSVTDSSFDAWTKFYQQDEDAPNAIVSYYSKGCMVAFVLDLTLRLDGGTSLDAVMRRLYERYGETGNGVPEDGVQAAIAKLTDLDLKFMHILNAGGLEKST